jgi:SAM-dependent methyltransferase
VEFFVRIEVVRHQKGKDLMPTIEENQSWNDEPNWKQAGDEWSEGWGGVDNEWWGTIYPRIHQFVPAATILEIAPGFGRWTHYLANLCQHLVAVDLNPRCIDGCKERFAGSNHIEYHVNDGRSLPMIKDGSIDFCFSFDSLVHCDAYILEDYLKELARKLASDGVAFIHHSNLEVYMRRWLRVSRFLFKARPRRITHKLYYAMLAQINPHWRAADVSATVFRGLCAKVGLRCISQEMINWYNPRLNDCFSTITRETSRWSRPTEVIVNKHFAEECELLRRLWCKPQQSKSGRSLASR